MIPWKHLLLIPDTEIALGPFSVVDTRASHGWGFSRSKPFENTQGESFFICWITFHFQEFQSAAIAKKKKKKKKKMLLL